MTTATTEDRVRTNHEVADRMRRHHAAMAAATQERVAALEQAAAGEAAWQTARDAVVSYVRSDIVPHAKAEESTIYAEAAKRPELAPLVQAMTLEHGAILERLAAIERARSAVEALRAGAGLETLFAAHAGIENDVILAQLEIDPAADLTDVLARMHAGLKAGAAEPASASEASEAHIDVREIPHAERHALIFGVVRHLRPGQTLVLTVDHDPLPLRYQLQAEYGERLTWTYRAQGPKTWMVALSFQG